MKNYELMALLEKLPAGADVSFCSILEQREVVIIEDSDDGELYDVNKNLCSVDFMDEKIMLS